MLLAVMMAEVATPFAFVVAVVTLPANVTLAVLWAGAVKVTIAPEIGFPPASVTVATSGFANAVFTCALCELPLVTTTLAAGPDWFVREKAAVDAEPHDAMTLYAPAKLFAETVADVATPCAFVTAVFTPPAKVALAPVCAGAVNVTVAPETGLPDESVTITDSGLANAVEIAAV